MENIRLLLVDDEDEFRQTLGKRLSKRRVVTEQAGSGEEALAILAQKPIDVVVLDIKMPGMSGIETLQRIKQEHPKTEVIILTGHSTTQDGVEGIKLGAFDYLGKPVEFEHLLSKIKQADEKIQREEEKKKESEFRAKMEQQMIATERLASLGTLAAGVAHEINNPLAIIGEAVGWMKSILMRKELENMPLKENLQMALDKIDKSKERAKRITHQLLGFARKTDSMFKEVDLGELVDEVVVLVEREAFNKEVEIIKEYDMQFSTIWTDPSQLRQVLINVVTNAIQASRPRERITITMDVLSDGIVIAVKDIGEGIPGENLERIFEPFFSTKPTGQGTGLGLSVSRGIIEKIGGRIAVESGLGRGSTFRIYLPKTHKNSTVRQDLEP